MGAQVLVESTVFTGVKYPVCSRGEFAYSILAGSFTDDTGVVDSDDVGYAVVNDVEFGSGANTAEAGTLKSVPYSYKLLGSAAVKAAVVGTAGNTLKL